MGYIDDMRAEIRGESTPRPRKAKVKTVIRYVPVGYAPYPMYPQPVRTTKRRVSRANSQKSYWAMLREEQGKDAYSEYKSNRRAKQLERIAGGARVVGTGLSKAGRGVMQVGGAIGQRVSKIQFGSIYGGIFKKKLSMPKATKEEVD